ncbi:TPA: LPXTG cell wall anchor domain-containing protein [Streptococcus suis]
MHAKKLVKWGVALTSTLVLGGVVGPVGGNLVNTTSVVYAQEAEAIVRITNYDDANNINLGNYEKVLSPGEVLVLTPPSISGYDYVGDNYSFEIDYNELVGKYGGSMLIVNHYKPVETPADQPTEVPVETPTEQPTDKTTEQPISVAIIAISEADGPLSHYYVTINPGETKTVEAPKVDGYKLEQYAGPTYELTYDYALGLMNSGGSAWVQFWMIKDTAPATPVDQPVEQPAEKPVEQPVETPAGQPTETPTTTPIKQPVEQPAESPTEKPAEQPVETPVGQPTETPATTPIEQPAEQPVEIKPAETLTAQPAETKPVEQPVEQPAEKPAEQPVEKPVETPTDKPVEKPVETPTDKPVEQPVETPTDQPTEKPTATSLPAGNTASKAQTVATTDKKKVDNSTPSTNTVKPEEGSQATAKTLPKTGDSSSMLLVLGGLLSGLSGLGLAAITQKRLDHLCILESSPLRAFSIVYTSLCKKILSLRDLALLPFS